MDILQKILLSFSLAMGMIIFLVVMDNAHRLSESVKDKMLFISFIGMLTFGPLWFDPGEHGASAIGKLLVLVGGHVFLNYVLYPPDPDSMDSY